jgi:hypothetical protein
MVLDSRVLRNEILRTPSDPEGSSGSKSFRVPQGNLDIFKNRIQKTGDSSQEGKNTISFFCLNDIILTPEF